MRSLSTIGNATIKILLQNIGKKYDEKRGFAQYSKSKLWKDCLSYFNNECCYCGIELTKKNRSEDHLIPINKNALGLHSWGNVIPCCYECNHDKRAEDWEIYLKKKCNNDKILKERKLKIEKFVKKYKYKFIADNRIKKILDNAYENAKISISKIVDNGTKDILDMINEKDK